jgi:hypothetical protein
MTRLRLILSVLTIITLTVPAFAAPVSTTAKVDQKMGVGVYAMCFSNTADLMTFVPTLGMNFTKEFRGEVGLSNVSVTPKEGDPSSILGFVLRGEYSLAPNEKVSPHWGGIFGYFSGSLVGESISGTSLGVFWGITAALANNFTVYADIYPIKYTSTSGKDVTTGTETSILTGAIGARYYF